MANLGEPARRFEFDGCQLPLEAPPSHNIPPTRQVLTVRDDLKGRPAVLMRWGLIPLGPRTRQSGSA